MAESDILRPSTSYSGTSGIQRRFLLSSPGRPRTATGLRDPNYTATTQAGLSVKVTIKFQPSLDLTYQRQYRASNGFQPTDQTCQALLRRLAHCSDELLTRKDSTALQRTIPQIGDGKPLRFELIYQIYRGGPEPWATKSFKSYQKFPLDKATAMEVARSTDRIVGSFLKLHDRSFRWTHGKIRERSGSDLELLKPLSNPVSLLHIPQSRFIDATQDWEFIPGYEITLLFQSRCKSRRQRKWERTITLQSTQSSPLTLSHGEDMAWALSTAMQRSLDSRKMAFDKQHRSCNRYDFLEGCHHSEQNAVHIGFQIRNQLGLDHKHLRREIDSNLLLFQQPDGLDCEQFVNQLKHAFAAVRDDTDKELTEMDDLRLTVYEMSGRGWKAEKPFAVCLDSTACYSRRTIKAILDRVQTGVADVLGGNDISITLMIHKRGHLVLDKTLVARSPSYATGQRQGEDPEIVKELFMTKIKERIQSDISMVVKDTCALFDSEPQNIRVIDLTANDPAEMEAFPSSRPLPILTSNGTVSDSFDDSSNEPSEPQVQGETLQNGGGGETMADGVIGTVEPSQYPETPAKAAIKDQFDRRSSLSFSLSEDRYSPYSTSSSSTPSLADSDIGTPRDSLLVTPPFLRTLTGRPRPFDANPNVADFETSDNELMEESVIGSSTPTMARVNGPRQFNIFGKNTHSVSRQSVTSIESEPDRRSLVEREPATEPENVVPEPDQPMSELSVNSESLPSTSPELQQEATAQQPAFEGWLEYCCEPIDEEESVESERLVGQKTAGVPEIKEPIREECLIVVIPDEETSPALNSRPIEGFLEYAIETIVEEDEKDSETEFHDADSIAPAAIMSSPSSFATVASGLTSPMSLDFSAFPSLKIDEGKTTPVLGAIPFSAEIMTSEIHEAEVIQTSSVAENVLQNPVIASQIVACTSAHCTVESNSAQPDPKKIELIPVPEGVKPSSVSPEPCEPRHDSSAELRRDPSFIVSNEESSIFSDIPHTPTSESAPSFSDQDELREPSSPPPHMTETEESDYSETSEPPVPFPETAAEPAVHDDSKSLSLWAPSRASFIADDFMHNYFSLSRKESIPRSLYLQPNLSLSSLSRTFSHKRLVSSPTAGLFGIGEPRRLDIPLRSALFGLAALRKQEKPRSNSQVLLRLENDMGMVIVPGSHSNPSSRRNSDFRGIGGVGILGLGSAYGF